MNRRTFLKFLAAATASLTIKHKPQVNPPPDMPVVMDIDPPNAPLYGDVRQLYNQNFMVIDGSTSVETPFEYLFRKERQRG